jgi:hypothetical protein
MELIEWAKLQEKLLKVQLSVIRDHIRAAKSNGKEEGFSRFERKSQMSMVMDILSDAGKPLHILEIIRIAEDRYGIKLDRESMVSALTKKVNKGVTFVRTGPNTFTLKGE